MEGKLLWPLIIYIAGWSALTRASSASTSAPNRIFDPDDWARRDKSTIASCSIPPPQDPDNYFKPENGRDFCSSSVSPEEMSDDDIHQIAVAYAPVLFFHPLEEHSLQTPDVIFEDPSKGRIFNNDDGEYILVDDTLNLTALLLTSNGTDGVFSGGSHFFEFIDPNEEYKAGAGYVLDEEHPGRSVSRASIYYNVLDYSESGIWVINYYFFFTWQGSQTFGFGVGDNKYTIRELEPYGEHEGDWESMSVMICAPESTTSGQQSTSQLPQPLAVTYQEHAFSEITDCTKGECIFWKDSGINPVGFVALGSHATYPVTSRNHVYAAFPFNLFYFIPGFFFLSDQTVFRDEETGEYRMFLPTSSNLVRHKNPEDIILNVSPESEYWQGYGGKWGESRVGDSAIPPEDPSRCFNSMQNAYLEECPNVSLADAIVKFLQSYTTEVLGAIVPSVARFLQPNVGPVGPGAKFFFYDWLPPESADLYYCLEPYNKIIEDEEMFCRWLGDPVLGDEEEDGDGEDIYSPRIFAIVLDVAIRTTAFVSNIVGFFVSWP